MINNTKSKLYRILRWSEKYAKTDMVYLAKGGFWLSSGQILSNIASFLLSIAFANWLSPETYGTYRYVLSVCGILAIPALPGMGAAITRSVAQGFEGSAISAMKAKIRWGLLGGLASLILAAYYYFGNNQQLAISFLIAAAFLPVMDAFSIYDAILLGKKEFRKTTFYSVISQIVATACLIITAFVSGSLFLIVSAYFLSWTALRLFFLWRTVKKLKLNRKTDPQSITYGKHLSLMSIIGNIANYLDRLLLFHYLGAAQVAIYSIAIAPPEQIKGLFKNLNALSLPKFSANEKTNPYTTKLIISKSLQIFLACSVVVLAYILCAPFIYRLFFPQYLESVIYSQIFSISLITVAIVIPYTILQARADKKALYKFNIYSSIIQIAPLIILIPLYGIMGAVIARLASRFINLAVISIMIKKSS